MFRSSWPCLVLALLLLTGCISLGSTQTSSQQSSITTPAQGQAQIQVMDAATRRALLAKRQAAAAASLAARAAPFMQSFHSNQPITQPPSAAKVALLAPLSGKSGALGQAMVNAAQLALFDIGYDDLELIPRDTKGTTDGAVQAARDAVASGANLLIGPLFAADVAAVKPIVRDTSISMLSLSTDVALAESGIFVMGFAPTPQVSRVISFAYERGLTRFAAIIPAGPYGKLVSKAFEDEVNKLGGAVVAKVSMENINALASKKGQIDAIFLPLGAQDLRHASSQLRAAGFEKDSVRLLGTGLWDEPSLAQAEPYLVGGWYPAAEPQARDRFVDAYQNTYDLTPPRLATLAYDATALAAVLAKNKAPYNRETLCIPSGFAGLDGLFRLLPNGQIERGLAVLEVSQGSNLIIDSAPASF